MVTVALPDDFLATHRKLCVYVYSVSVCACMHAFVYMSCVIYLVLFSPDKTVGLFWMNAAETWIDISSATAGQVGS